jgi:hypothetical protein
MDDEVVETSDPEELEELRSIRQHNPPQVRFSQTDGRQSPRKRLKVSMLSIHPFHLSSFKQLHHEYSDIAPRSTSADQASSSRFRSTSGSISPASLTRASSPKPSPPIATPPISLTDASINEVALHHAEDPFASRSQDPLLLGVIVSPKLDMRSVNATPPGSRSSSPRIDYADTAFPMVVDADYPISPSRRSASVDPLLLFTPSRPSIHNESGSPTEPLYDVGPSQPISSSVPSSPLTQPLADRLDKQGRPPDVSPSRSASPPNHANDNQSRYSLRVRQLKHLRPYEYDHAKYTTTMKYHPEAIVRIRSARRHHTRGDEYEEVQTQDGGGYEAENDDPDDERRTRRHSTSRSKSRGPMLAEEILPSLPTTDEEEEREIDAMRKEGRKLRPEQKVREGARRHGRKKAKPFPLKELNDSDVELRTSRVRVTFPSLFCLTVPYAASASCQFEITRLPDR